MKSYNLLGIIIFSLVAAVYLITLDYRPYPFAFLVKSTPIFVLMILVFLNIPDSRGKRIGLGLLFSAIGDILLALHSKNSFVFGVIAFTIAHFFYISVFLKEVRLKKSRIPVILAMSGYSIAMGIIMFPKLGAMFIPLMGYLTIILIMGLSAALGEKNHPLIVTGACLFIISDSLIAINGFINPIPFSSLWVMITYYAAQALIAKGSIESFT
jgi:alkenylglycerophosphocholine hydrolase